LVEDDGSKDAPTEVAPRNTPGTSRFTWRVEGSPGKSQEVYSKTLFQAGAASPVAFEFDVGGRGMPAGISKPIGLLLYTIVWGVSGARLYAIQHIRPHPRF
jgi:hypothetical protein